MRSTLLKILVTNIILLLIGTRLYSKSLETTYPEKLKLYTHTQSSSQTTTNLLFVSMNLTNLGILYMWNHKVFVLL